MIMLSIAFYLGNWQINQIDVIFPNILITF